MKYFEHYGVDWQIREDVRHTIEFRQLNLADSWPTFPTMDIVFLHPVLIYFDLTTKKTILGKICCLLRPDGCLFLGAAETTLNLDDGFEHLPLEKAGYYCMRA